MANFLLVHGAWHGGWCWKKVLPLLRHQGHEVFTPTLTGLGDRSHLLTREVDLETHVQDILALLSYEDLNEVILVGHSYSGMVITGVADRAADRLARLVYFDAIIPKAGQSLFDTTTPSFRNAVLESIERDGDGWLAPPASLASMGVTDAKDVEWMEPKLCAHPAATGSQPLQFDTAVIQGIPRTYLRCTSGNESLIDTAARLKADEAWQYIEIESGHDAMITVPQQLAETLLDLA